MRPARSAGFSLLETLAAMFLLAMCFGVLMRAAGASMNLNARAAGYTQASLWASSLLDRSFVSEFPPAGDQTGRFDDTYAWRMRITMPDDARAPTLVPLQLYRVELTVTWREGGHDLSERFETLRVVSTLPKVAPVTDPQG